MTQPNQLIKLLPKMDSGTSNHVEYCDVCGMPKIKCLCDCPGCKICGGKGLLKVNPDAQPGQYGFGVYKVCPNKSKRDFAKMIARGEMIGGLTAKEAAGLDWENVLPNVSGGDKALPILRPAYARGYGMFLLFGTFGQAKTLLMKIMVAKALRDGKRAAYARMSDVLNDIRLAYDEPERKTTALLDKIERWKELDLLAIDEINRANETGWAQDTMFTLFDERWVGAVRQSKFTIMAANYASEDNVPGYLLSRIKDSRWSRDESGSAAIYLNGDDGRLSMPKDYPF